MRYEEDYDFENSYEDRTVSPSMTGDDSRENELRPQSLEEYIGQEKAKENLRIYIEAAMHLTTFFSTALPDSVRPLFPTSSQMKWALISR